MTIWDDRILEVIDEEGPDSPTPISEHKYIHIGPSGVSKRLNRMQEHGLVTEIRNGVYTITPKGKRYLNGEIDASEIEDETENGDAHAEA